MSIELPSEIWSHIGTFLNWIDGVSMVLAFQIPLDPKLLFLKNRRETRMYLYFSSLLPSQLRILIRDIYPLVPSKTINFKVIVEELEKIKDPKKQVWKLVEYRPQFNLKSSAFATDSRLIRLGGKLCQTRILTEQDKARFTQYCLYQPNLLSKMKESMCYLGKEGNVPFFRVLWNMFFKYAPLEHSEIQVIASKSDPRIVRWICAEYPSLRITYQNKALSPFGWVNFDYQTRLLGFFQDFKPDSQRLKELHLAGLIVSQESFQNMMKDTEWDLDLAEFFFTSGSDLGEIFYQGQSIDLERILGIGFKINTLSLCDILNQKRKWTKEQLEKIEQIYKEQCRPSQKDWNYLLENLMQLRVFRHFEKYCLDPEDQLIIYCKKFAFTKETKYPFEIMDYLLDKYIRVLGLTFYDLFSKVRGQNDFNNGERHPVLDWMVSKHSCFRRLKWDEKRSIYYAWDVMGSIELCQMQAVETGGGIISPDQKRRCLQCGKIFQSRNRFFEHLRFFDEEYHCIRR